jgi:hypothetical protein
MVFRQRDHIATIRRTWFTIWNKALPECRGKVEKSYFGKGGNVGQ